MKKFKLIFAALVCVFVMCPLFAGCAAVDVTYIKGSTSCTYDFDSYAGISYITIDYRFRVEAITKGDYTVSFSLEVYQDSTEKENLLETFDRTLYFTSAGNEEKVLSDTIFEQMNETSNLKFSISKIKITRSKKSKDFKGYAIGFGVAGGALFYGITAYFIVDKLVLSQKKDN